MQAAENSTGWQEPVTHRRTGFDPEHRPVCAALAELRRASSVYLALSSYAYICFPVYTMSRGCLK